MLNVEPSNLVFFKTYNAEFDKTIKRFTNENGRPLEIKDKVNLILLIDKIKWRVILYHQEQENISKNMDFLRNLSNKYEEQLLDTGLNVLKAASKKVFHKVVEATGAFIGNKIADKIEKPKTIPNENPRNVEDKIIPSEKRGEILNKLRQVL